MMLEVGFEICACKGGNGQATFLTDSPEITHAIASLKTATAKEAARRMLWEAMDMSVGENPEVQDLGAMPLALDAEVGFAGDEIEEEEDKEDDDDAVDSSGVDFLQLSSQVEKEQEDEEEPDDEGSDSGEEDAQADGDEPPADVRRAEVLHE